MKPSAKKLMLSLAALLAFAALGRSEIKVVVDRNDPDQATAAFKFATVPSPSATDLATHAKFSLVDGVKDDNGGDLDKLNDGKLPTEADQPSENFFFDAGTPGGRLLVDLGDPAVITQVNTYSWHPSDRGPQVYTLYAADGTAQGFNLRPKSGTDPASCGWTLVAKVDTRPKSGSTGGQYGVSISNSDGPLGKYRYLLFDISRTEITDDFGNTFYSEIDVIGEGGANSPTPTVASDEPFIIHSPDDYCTISIDTSAAPDLKDWADNTLAPVLAEWYPRISTMLASDGYSSPKAFRVRIRPGRGVAATGGTNVTANSDWFKNELHGEGVGALVHEEVHVVQQYGGRRHRGDSNWKRPPGWLVEGMPDYIRWFLFEPQSHGADVYWLASRRRVELKYDAGYRVSANFLDYVVRKYDKDLITQLNAACREGRYDDTLWKGFTGKELPDLVTEWKTSTEAQITALADADKLANTLTDSEKAAGWKLLFDGKDFDGWHNFRHEGVRPGWEVKDGLLVCADPHNAGDIVTSDKFDWFELQLDYNISVAGNSGIMYHVTDEGRSIWATGPEFQLEDNVKAADPIRCGWLYALYKPPMDPVTGKPIDATFPVGKWNHVRLLITPQKCVHEINGVEYFEYVLGSDDFKARVAKSKFARMPNFAKSDSGYIGLQGDHGRVEFRNIKIRPVVASP